jgi:SAM-dependent methyltransferase
MEVVMALTCPIGFDTTTLRQEIQLMYGRVAASPGTEFHFHRGAAYAATRLGYDAGELARLPASVTASFAGVGNPHAVAPLRPGDFVLDVGSGAGTDLLLAARQVGPGGRAIGVDMTSAMRARATAGADACGLTNVDVRDGDATRLPVDDGTVDVVISNGVLNLVPDKPKAVREIARVLKPGGRVQIADIVIGEVLPESALRDIDLWTG